MASKAIEEKKHEMEATMVNLGDKVGSNIQQGLTNLPVMRRTEEEEECEAADHSPSSVQVRGGRAAVIFTLCLPF